MGITARTHELVYISVDYDTNQTYWISHENCWAIQLPATARQTSQQIGMGKTMTLLSLYWSLFLTADDVVHRTVFLSLGSWRTCSHNRNLIVGLSFSFLFVEHATKPNVSIWIYVFYAFPFLKTIYFCPATIGTNARHADRQTGRNPGTILLGKSFNRQKLHLSASPRNTPGFLFCSLPLLFVF